MCPFHNTERQISTHAQQAFAVTCQVASALGVYGRITIVWEAHLVKQFGPFDLWLYEHGVVIEVDGEQHIEGGFSFTSAEEQAARDREKDAAAVQAGLHVVRLHYQDKLYWGVLLYQVVLRVMRGAPPGNHYSPSYPRP